MSNNDNGSEVYGKLTEGLHVASYTLERAWINLESLLDGDGWQLGGRFIDVNAFMDSLRLGRFRAVAEDRKRIVTRIKELQPAVSNRQIGRTLGVDESTIRDDTAGNPADVVENTKQNNGADVSNAGNPAPEITGEQAAKLVLRKETGTAEKKERRAERERELGQKQLALPDIKCGVILEDFEWDFQVHSRDTGMDRHAANHYETAINAHTPEEIIERTKERLAVAADDCVLFKWVPIPFLAIGIHVIEGRGFEYKSSFVWGKDKIGTGYWNREKHEYLLIATKGKIPAPALGDQFDSLIMAMRTGHSEKPDFAYEIIERYFPTLPKIELNLRGKPRPGWYGWGNEAETGEAAE